MIIRLLVLLFVLNAFAPVAVASSCDMMNDADISSMSHDNFSDDVECCIDHDETCSTLHCPNGSVVNLPLLSLDNTKSFAVDVSCTHLKDNLLSLYKIFLPINTPPPLV